jgi:hypothetical protein
LTSLKIHWELQPTDDYDLLGALEARLSKAREKEAKRAESLRKLAQRAAAESKTQFADVDANAVAATSATAEEVEKLRRVIEAVKSKKRTAAAGGAN